MRTTYELQQAQLADPAAALQYEHQLAIRAAESIEDEHEPSPAPQAEAAPELDPAYSLPHANAGQSTERQAKVRLAGKADGSQDVGSKRKRDGDTGVCTTLLCVSVCAGLVLIKRHILVCELVLFIERELDHLICKAAVHLQT